MCVRLCNKSYFSFQTTITTLLCKNRENIHVVMCMQVRTFLVTTMRSFWIVQLIFGASHSKFSTFFGFPSSFFFRHFKLKGPHAIGMYGRTSRPCTFEATFSRDLRDFAKDFSRQHLASSSQGRKKSFFLKWHLQKRCKLHILRQTLCSICNFSFQAPFARAEIFRNQ